MLRIDLLPEHFAAARAAKLCLAAMVALLLISTVGCLGWMMTAKSAKVKAQESLDKWTAEADQVRALEAEAVRLEQEAAPIDGKVDFIEAADGCGEQYWAAWDKVNRYVFARARVLNVDIQAPNSVNFSVDLPDTTSVGRFILNLIRCPDISGIQISGSVPGGPAVGPGGGGGGGGGGGMGMGMGMDMGAMAGPGGPGMGGGGMMGGPMMGGMGGPMMGGGGGGGGTASMGGPINLTVSAQLAQGLSDPAPGGAAAGGDGGAPGMGGGMGGPGGGPGGGAGGFSGGNAGGSGA